MGGLTNPARQRAFRPRSANGCSPCKFARVKCQEEKPVCQRCHRLRLNCVYVAPPPRKKGPQGSVRPTTRSLLPAAPKQTLDAASGASSVVLPPSSFPSMTPERALYYDYFRTCVVKELCSQVPAGFWLRTVLRECTQDENTLNSAIGIGALAYYDRADQHENLPLLRRGQGPGNTEVYGHDRHYKMAVAYYTRALAQFRQRMSASTREPPAARSILISTLLFLVFELLQGDTAAVDMLSASCFAVLQSDLLRRDPRCGPVIAARLDDEGVQDAEFLLVRLAVLHGLTSPIFPATNRAAQTFRLPYGFNLQIPTDTEPNVERFVMVWKRLWTLVSLWHLQVSRGRIVASPTTMPAAAQADALPPKPAEELEMEKQVLLVLIKECRAVTERRLDNESNSVARRLLEYALALGDMHPMILTATADASDDIWDRNVEKCLSTVNLGWAFVSEAAATELSKSLIFDGPVPTLLQMVQGCRNAELRRSGTALLTHLVTPQSSWGIRSMFLGSRGLMNLEEEGRSPDGEIGMAARYDWTHAEWSDDYRRFHCTYTAKCAEPGTQPKEVRMVLRFEDYQLA